MVKYIIQKDEKSFCPKCNNSVYLLVQEGMKFDIAFYICFKCKYVGQVGVGEVKRLKESENNGGRRIKWKKEIK